MAISHTDISHTNVRGKCRRQKVDELACGCDAIFYMAAGKEPADDYKRFFESDVRCVLEDIAALKALREEVTCPGCLAEIDWQIPFQTKALNELREKWCSAGFDV
jgi:hypothetical protein